MSRPAVGASSQPKASSSSKDTSNQIKSNNSTTNDSSNAASQSNLLTNLAVTTSESVKLIAETIGINNLNDEAAKEVVNDLTFTLKSILLVNLTRIFKNIAVYIIGFKYFIVLCYFLLRMLKNLREKVVENI